MNARDIIEAAVAIKDATTCAETFSEQLHKLSPHILVKVGSAALAFTHEVEGILLDEAKRKGITPKHESVSVVRGRVVEQILSDPEIKQLTPGVDAELKARGV